MDTKTFIKKYDSREQFTEQEIHDIVILGFDDDNYEVIQEVNGENRRWSRRVALYYKISDRYFQIAFDEGLTELQDNDYSEQPQEVTLHYETSVVVNKVFTPLPYKIENN